MTIQITYPAPGESPPLKISMPFILLTGVLPISLARKCISFNFHQIPESNPASFKQTSLFPHPRKRPSRAAFPAHGLLGSRLVHPIHTRPGLREPTRLTYRPTYSSSKTAKPVHSSFTAVSCSAFRPVNWFKCPFNTLFSRYWRSNPPLNSDPACIAFRSLSASRFLGFVHRPGAGGAG